MTEGPDFIAHTSSEIAMLPPYGEEDCYSTTITKDVDPSQLADELASQLGYAVQVVVIRPLPEEPIDEEHPANLYVHPPVDGRTVRAKIRSHVIDPDYGFTPEQLELRELRAKLARKEVLTQEELMRALHFSLQMP